MRELLDPELGGYTAVTYQASRLHPAILEGNDVVLASRATDPQEVAALAVATGATLRHLENDYRLGRDINIIDAIIQAVRSRYDCPQLDQ